MQLIPYLMYNGNCEEAMNFYADALSATITHVQRYGEAPMPSDDDWKNKIMHAGLRLGEQSIFFSDSMKGQELKLGDNVQLSIDYKNEADMDEAFTKLSAGGVVTMPMQDTFWGAKFGVLKDKFGVNWMFNFDKTKA